MRIDDLVKRWVQPLLTNARVREDLRRFTASLHRQTMVDAGARLPQLTKPALIACSADDRFFALEDAHRLADALPDSRLEFIENSRTFSMIDQPDALAELIAEFARSPQPVLNAARVGHHAPHTVRPKRSNLSDARPAVNIPIDLYVSLESTIWDERDRRISRLAPTARAQEVRRQREQAWGVLLRARLRRLQPEDAARLLDASESLRALARDLADGDQETRRPT